MLALSILMILAIFSTNCLAMCEAGQGTCHIQYVANFVTSDTHEHFTDTHEHFTDAHADIGSHPCNQINASCHENKESQSHHHDYITIKKTSTVYQQVFFCKALFSLQNFLKTENKIYLSKDSTEISDNLKSHCTTVLLI